MATGGHKADEVVAVATTTSSRQPAAERSATGDQLAIPPPPQDVGSVRPARVEKKQRHTADQIQLMEAVFKECLHPDYIQRQKLSEELGLTPKQVLFWFQNRRTQLRGQQNKAENAMLLEEHERLKWENNQLKADMSKLSCPRCVQLQEPSPEKQQLFFENARLREQASEIEQRAADAFRALRTQPGFDVYVMNWATNNRNTTGQLRIGGAGSTAAGARSADPAGRATRGGRPRSAGGNRGLRKPPGARARGGEELTAHLVVRRK